MAWPKKAPRVNECGHPERKHKAHGMCDACYSRQQYRDLPEDRKVVLRARSTERNKQEYVRRKKLVSKRYVERYKETKALIMAHYGDKCACCGETEFHFLTLDHINNDGAKQRAKIGRRTGFNLYRWLINHGYPDGLQTLCYNCNCGRARNGGICPHKVKDGTGQPAYSVSVG